MTDSTALPERKSIRWPFAPGDGYSSLQEQDRLLMIHSLPGVLVWPVLLFGLAILFQLLATSAWIALGGQEYGVTLQTAQFAGSALAYSVLALLMWHHFGIYAANRPAFSVIPRHLSELGAAVLVLIFMLTLGGPITVWFHEFAMMDFTQTLAGGAELSDVSNVDNVVQSGAAIWAIILLTLIAAPLVEEILFRGWMLPMLIARGVPSVFAVVISGVAFGLIHTGQGLMVMTSTCLLGIALGVARLVTGRVAAPVLGHMANNAWAIFAIPLLSGMQAG